MNEGISFLIMLGISVFVVWLIFRAMVFIEDKLHKGKKGFLFGKELSIKKPRLLTKEEATMLADYFHNEEHKPDDDGFVGSYWLPEEVMKEYRKKYSKERDWE